MRVTASCPGCRESMSPQLVLCASCTGKLPASYTAAMTRTFKLYSRSSTPEHLSEYEAACRRAARKVKAILDGTDARNRRRS